MTLKKRVFKNLGKWMLLIGLPVMAGMQGCLKDYPNNAADSWKPSFASPLSNGNLTINNLLLNNDSNKNVLQQNSDKTLSIVYRSSVQSQYGGACFTIPDQSHNFTPTLFSAGSLAGFNAKLTTDTTIIDTLSINTPGFPNVELGQIALKTANFTINTSSSFQDSVKVTFDVPGLILTDASHLHYVTGSSLPFVDNKSNDIAGATIINLSKSKLPYTIRIQRTKKKNAQLSDNIAFNIGMTNIAYSYVVGRFSGINIPMPSGALSMEAFNNFNKGGLQLDSPSVKIYSRNSFGLPTYLYFDTLNAVGKNGQVVSLPLTQPFGQTVNNPSLLQNGAINDVLKMDKGNSHITQAMNVIPSKFRYKFTPRIGGTQGFIRDTSNIKLDVETEFPLNMSINNLVMLDTFKVNSNSISNVDKAEGGSVRLNTVNGFPFTINLQIYFYDKINKVIVDSLVNLPQNVIPAGTPVNGSNHVQASNNNADFAVSGDRLKKIVKANAIITKAIINTNNNQLVRFYSDYKLAINTGILLTKVDLK